MKPHALKYFENFQTVRLRFWLNGRPNHRGQIVKGGLGDGDGR